MAAPAPKPPRQRRGRSPRLTRRAKHWHNGIIGRVGQARAEQSAAGFFMSRTFGTAPQQLLPPHRTYRERGLRSG